MTNTNSNNQTSKTSGVNLGETSIEITDLKCLGPSALSPIDGNLTPMPVPIPKPDRSAIMAALAVLFTPDDVSNHFRESKIMALNTTDALRG